MKTNLRIVLLFATISIVVLCSLPLFFSTQVSEEVEFILSTELDEVHDTFNEPQKFKYFNGFLKEDSLVKILFYYPYSGVGSSMEWNTENSTSINSWLKIKSSLPKRVVYEVYLTEIERFIMLEVKLSSMSSGQTMVHIQATTEEIPYFTRYFNYYIRKVISKALEDTKNKMIQWYKEREKIYDLIMKKPGTIKELILPEMHLLGVETEIANDPSKFHELLLQKSSELKHIITDSLKVASKFIDPHPYLVFNDIEQLTNPKAKLYFIWLGYRVKSVPNKTGLLTLKTIDPSRFFVMYHNGKFGFIEKITTAYDSYFSSRAIEASKSIMLEFLKIPPADTLDYEIQALRW